MKVEIVRTDGRREQHEVHGGDRVCAQIGALIGADTVDVVNLRDGRVMLVDDNGYDTVDVEVPPPPGYGFAIERQCVRGRKAVNPTATALYHAVCVPGTTHQIVGDVAVVRDEDFT
jgi:hypothetical protein